MTLPVLDISSFISGSDVERSLFAKHLVEVSKEHGFIKIRNHGLTSDTVNALFAWVRQSSLEMTVSHLEANYSVRIW